MEPNGGIERESSRTGGARLDDALARVEMLARACTGSVEPSEVLSFVLRQGLAFLDARTATVVALDADRAPVPVLSAAAGDEPAALTLLDLVVVAEVAAHGRPLYVPSAAAAVARFPALADLAPPHAASAAVPLVHRGSVFGALGFGFAGARELDATERRGVEALADVCGLALGARGLAG